MNDIDDSFAEVWNKFHADVPHALWHYTDAGGVLGILQSNQLWLSDAAFLNDSSEMSYAVTVIEEIIGERLGEEGYSPLVKEYLDNLLKSITSRVKDDQEFAFVNPAFVCCFCEQKDSLHLWRAYSSGGRGYSIGFYLDTIYNKLKPIKIRERAVSNKRLVETWFCFDPYLCRVNYKKDEQRQIINSLIETVVKAIEANPDDFPSGNLNNFHKSIAISRIYNLFYLCLFSFKHPLFADEREWRLVYARRFGQSEDLSEVAAEELHYRSSGGYFLPFLKIDVGRKIEIEDPADAPEMKKLIFETIYAGPGLDVKLARAAINSYIYRNGYLGYMVEIKQSEVPLRSL